MLSLHNQAKPYLQRQPKRLERQKGVVIVVALFIVALVATMAYVMMERLERDTRQTTLIMRNAQAEMYVQGSIAWAIDQLSNDWVRQKKDQLIDPVPIKSPVDNRQGYKIRSTIYDMQARFNVNNVSTPEGLADFQRLLRAVKPELTVEQAQEISQSVFYWITPQTADGLRNKYYTELPVPYRAAGRMMQSVSELRLVKGMTPVLFNALRPYITALPIPTPINVQTAEAPVLMSISSEMSLATAKAIETIRVKNPILSPEVFSNLDVIKNHPIEGIKNKVICVSSYFLVETDITMTDQHLVIFTLLERNMNGNNPVVTILWQAKGTW